MARRAFLLGKRFAMPSSPLACDRCVFGTGEHAEFCAKFGMVEPDPEILLPPCGKRECDGRRLTPADVLMFCDCEMGRQARLAQNPVFVNRPWIIGFH